MSSLGFGKPKLKPSAASKPPKKPQAKRKTSSNSDKMDDDMMSESEENDEEDEDDDVSEEEEAEDAAPSKPDPIQDDLKRWDQQHGIGPNGSRINSSSESRRSKSNSSAPTIVAAAAAASSSSSSSSSASSSLDKAAAAAAAVDADAGDSESESDDREDDDDDGGDDIASYFRELARHQKWARREQRHPTASSSRPAPIDPADPLWLLLPLLLIDLRHAQGFEPVPRDLVNIIFDYAQPLELSYELKLRKEDWRDEHDGPTEQFESLGDVLPVMANNMPDISEEPQQNEQQAAPRGRRRNGGGGGYERWDAVYGRGGPLNTRGEMPEWDMMLDEQACRDEFVSDSHFDPPLIDTERRDKIKAKGQVPIPVTRIERIAKGIRVRHACGERGHGQSP
jgi:hypothetical protein